MFDHVEFGIRSFKESLSFYKNCLSCLGYDLKFSSEEHRDFAFGAKEGGSGLLLMESEKEYPPMHIAFKAKSEDEVNDFYAKAVEAGGKCNGKPGYRENYSPGYYAAFVIDPNGHNIEAVYRAGS